MKFQIMFDNHAHSGKILITLSSDVQIRGCKNWNVSGSSKFIYDTVSFMQKITLENTHWTLDASFSKTNFTFLFIQLTVNMFHNI